MLGIINLYKPVGKTSHDMVSFIRRTLKIKRVGHTGTLDPCAEGVLPILVGRATSLSDYLMAGDKVYSARIKLGVTTDTYDMTGKILEQKEAKATQDDIENVAKLFVGEIMQVPPMYSAIKIGGKKLCDMARRGQEIERPARKIRIDRIDVFDFCKETNEVSIRVYCSKGTYIRSLCFDIGQKLGCGASMMTLVREKTGIFDLENSFTPDEIIKAVENEDFSSFLVSPDSVLTEFDEIKADEITARKIKNGILLRLSQVGIKSAPEGKKFRVYENDTLICLSEVVKDDDGNYVLKIDKGFY